MICYNKWMTDLSNILKRHKSGWIALTSDNEKLVGTGKTLKEALLKARKKGIVRPSLLKIGPLDNYFIG